MGIGKTLVMSVKITLMSTGLLTIAILFSSLSTSNHPSLFSTLRSSLRPPYLYFLITAINAIITAINAIITAINIIISAIAFLHHNHHQQTHHEPAPPPPSKATMMTSHHADPHVVSVTDDPAVVEDLTSSDDYNDVVSYKHVEDEAVEKFADVEKRKTVVGDDVDISTVVDPSTWTAAPPPLMRQDAWNKVSPERTPSSSRFAQHGAPAKPAPTEGGKARQLRVHKPKEHDTLESTWKTITEGRHVTLNRHLKKSDTWENHPRQINLLDDDDNSSSPSPTTAVKNSKTFKEQTNYRAPRAAAPSKLKKEPSLDEDELNRRVYAFINKFNEDMRLQRQESMQQFMEMINLAT